MDIQTARRIIEHQLESGLSEERIREKPFLKQFTEQEVNQMFHRILEIPTPQEQHMEIAGEQWEAYQEWRREKERVRLRKLEPKLKIHLHVRISISQFEEINKYRKGRNLSKSVRELIANGLKAMENQNG